MGFPTRIVLAYLALVSAASAGELDVTSRIDAVTVYPDGATVTRVIRIDLPAGDSTLVAHDFPTSLDPASLRVEGEGGARLMIGAIDARPPRPEPPATLPELERRIEALKDERGVLDDKIAAAKARRKFAERFADSAPAGLGEKGEARPLRRLACGLRGDRRRGGAGRCGNPRGAGCASARSIARWRGSRPNATPIRRARWT